jgi:hypothetical protein
MAITAQMSILVVRWILSHITVVQLLKSSRFVVEGKKVSLAAIKPRA